MTLKTPEGLIVSVVSVAYATGVSAPARVAPSWEYRTQPTVVKRSQAFGVSGGDGPVVAAPVAPSIDPPSGFDPTARTSGRTRGVFRKDVVSDGVAGMARLTAACAVQAPAGAPQ